MINNLEMPTDSIDLATPSTVSNDPKTHKPTIDEIKESEDACNAVSFFNLFRFATRLDTIMLIIGLVSAFAHGAITPFLLLFFVNIIETFRSEPTDACMHNTTVALPAYFELNNFSISANHSKEIRAHNQSLGIYSNNILRQQFHKQSLGLIVTGCLVLVLSFSQKSLLTLACERQTKRIREMFFGNLVQKSVFYFEIHTIGELTAILNNNINKIHDGIGSNLGTAVQLTAKCFVGLAIAFAHGYKLTLVMCFVAPVIWIVAIISSKILANLFAKELRAYECAGAIAEEVISSVRTVFVFGGVEHEQARFNKYIEISRKQGIRKEAVNGLVCGIMYFIVPCSYCVAFWYGDSLIQNESYKIGNIILVFFSILSSIFSLGQCVSCRESIVEAKVAATSLWNVLRIKKKTKTKITNNEISGGNFHGAVKFHDVSFSYPSRPDVPVLRGLNFEVVPGERVALVGASGSGKSTCFQLLQQFYKPTSGQILLEGQDIDCFQYGELSKKIGVVNQEPVLFSTTILKNIQYGNPDATFDDIQAAAILAYAHNFIMSLPEKYDTVVGEHGVQLSGGERQRIVIARALVRKPTLLLLDEASSALDNQSEKIVQQALFSASKNTTTIIIAHRLSTVRQAHKIVVIDNGIAVEEGTHETLMKLKSAYYNLVQAQIFEKSNEHIEKHLSELTSSCVDDVDDTMSNDATEDPLLAEKPKSKNLTESQREADSDNKSNWPTLEILKLNRPEIPLMVIGALASMLHGSHEPLLAILLSEIIMIYRKCDSQVRSESVQFYSLMFVALGILSFIAMFTQKFMFACSGEALTKRLRAKAFRAILSQEIAWFDDPNNRTGALCTRLSTDAAMIQSVVGQRISSILSSFASLGVGITIAFFFSSKLSLLALPFILLMMMAGFLQGYLATELANLENNALKRAGSLFVETLQSIRTVKQLTVETQLVNDYCQLLDHFYRSSFKLFHILAFVYSLTTSLVFFAMAAIFFYGSILIERNEITFRNVLIVESCILFGVQAVEHGASLASDYGKAAFAAKRMISLFNRQSKIPSSSHGLRMETLSGDIHMKNVNFAYPTRPDKVILNDFNLRIKSGQRIAIVGMSGNGKSTVLHLLERFYDVQDGSVYIDSTDLREMNLNWWRSQIGVVTQDSVLFNASIADNLAYGDLSRHVTREEMIQAAKIANIHDFIQSLPQGYDTCVGPYGNRLSGGQKQRIAICRVLIRNPKVILFDEATSALDSENEKVVNEAVARAMIGRTCIIVTHRLSTIQDVDMIYVLHSGRIIESGTHHQLLAREGLYYRLTQCMKE